MDVGREGESHWSDRTPSSHLEGQEDHWLPAASSPQVVPLPSRGAYPGEMTIGPSSQAA